MIENGLVQLIRANYPGCEVLMGTSTAGIAHAAIVGHLMDLPMGYVRGSAKDHGRTNQIEGKLIPGQKAVRVSVPAQPAGGARHCQHLYLWHAKGARPPGSKQREECQPVRP